eukprot:scaffold123912_cov51-Phaeocystis_antarctica.AAC.1
MVGGRTADHLHEQWLVHNHAIEAQLQTVGAELEGAPVGGQSDLVGPRPRVLHIKNFGSSSGVDDGGREVARVLWAGHRVLHLFGGDRDLA